MLSLLEVLAYIAKLADPDKLDLYFSMPGESSKNKKCKTTTELVKAVESMRPNGPSSMKSDMNASIGSIIGNYQNKLDDRYSSKISWRRMSGSSVRPLSLYVLTDGVWQPNCSLDNTINSLVEMLKRFGLQGSQVGLQFVRFGNDEEGKTRLDHLDRLDRESGLKMWVYLRSTTATCGRLISLFAPGILLTPNLLTAATSGKYFSVPSTDGSMTTILAAANNRSLTPVLPTTTQGFGPHLRHNSAHGRSGKSEGVLQVRLQSRHSSCSVDTFSSVLSFVSQ